MSGVPWISLPCKIGVSCEPGARLEAEKLHDFCSGGVYQAWDEVEYDCLCYCHSEEVDVFEKNTRPRYNAP